MALNTPEVRVRPAPIPLFRFAPEGGRDTHRADASERVFEYWKRAQGEVDPDHLRLPRLVVRDHCGRKIDIYSSYQDKIYAARRNVRQTGQAKTPEEWRLPHGPPPAKPDLTRVGPPAPANRMGNQQPVEDNTLYRQQPFTVDVEDVSFIAERFMACTWNQLGAVIYMYIQAGNLWTNQKFIMLHVIVSSDVISPRHMQKERRVPSLRCLPDVASLSYLRHEFLAGNKLFLPILKACMLHERLLSALDRREQQYHTPNLCTGCIRSGLCYGCAKASTPHYHMDKVAKTGGGFTYYKRDRPGNLLEQNDPRNWSSRFRKEFQELAKQITAVSEVTDAEEGVADSKPMSLIPDFSLQYAQLDVSDLGLGTDEDAATAALSGDEGEDQIFPSGEVSMSDVAKLEPQEVTAKEAPSTARDSGMDDSSVCAKTAEVTDLQEVIPQAFGPEVFSYQGWVTEDGEFSKGDNQDNGKRVEDDSFSQQYGQSHVQRPSGSMDLSGLDGMAMTVKPQNVHANGGDDVEMADDEDTARGNDTKDQRHGTQQQQQQELRKRRQRLYKAPPPFKLKPREKKELRSESPFSTNRQYNIPKGDGFTVKKSDKMATQFNEFKRAGHNWKEPKKFELDQNKHKGTEFWSPPVRTEKNNKPRRKVPSKPLPISAPSPDDALLSPDSGLESEKFQVWVEQIIESAEQECNMEADWGYYFEVPDRLVEALADHGYSVPDDWILTEPEAENMENEGFLTPYYTDEEISPPSSVSDAYMKELSLTRETSRNMSSVESWDSMSSIGTPPQHDSPGLNLTSPELDLSLVDIGEEVLPLTYDDPIEVLDIGSSSLKKSRKKRRKRSKRLTSDEQSEQVNIDDIDIKVQSEEVGEKDTLKIINPRAFSPYLRSSEKYLSAVTSQATTGREQGGEQVKLQVVGKDSDQIPEARNDVTFQVKSPVASHTDLPDSPEDDSNQVTSRDSETRTNSTFSRMKSPAYSSGSSARGQASMRKSPANAGRGTLSVDSAKQSSASPRLDVPKPKSLIKSPEKIFDGLDEELLRKLPSIKVQLQKLGVELDSWKDERRKSQDSVITKSSSEDSDKGTELLSAPERSLSRSPRPTSSAKGASRTSHRLSVPSQEERCPSPMDTGKILPLISPKTQSDERCAMCGASLEHIALHICMPPMSTRHRVKKAKQAFPRRVSHPRETQRRIPVREVNSEVPSNTNEFHGKGNNLEETKQKLPPIESPPKLPEKEADTSKETDESDVTPPPEPPAPVKPKKTVLKRQKKEVVRKPQRPPSPKLPEIKRPPSVKPLSDDSVKSLTPPSTRSELSPLPPIEPPELPDFVFPESKPKPQRIKSMISAAPPRVQVKEVKKARKPPPKVRKQVKIKHAKRSVAEAPVTREELQQVTDPLDFLAKYCIIHVNRLPMYQHVFQKAVSQQKPRYQVETTPPVSSRDNAASMSDSAVTTSVGDRSHQNGFVGDAENGQPQHIPQLSPHEMKMLHDLTVINRAPSVMTTGVSQAEEYLDKLKFSFEVLHEKHTKLKQQLKELDARRLNIIATKAKEMFPDTLSTKGGKKASKKSGKKSAKKSAQSRVSKEVIFSEPTSPVGDKTPDTPTPPTLDPNSDAGIVGALSNKAFDAVSASPEVVRVEVEIELAEEKLQNVIGRLEELQGETNLVKMYCMEHFFQSQISMAKPKDFMRQQSGLYNSLHPPQDMEINLSEVGPALQLINNHLLTDKEMEYLFHILNLPGRTRINFQLFSVLAALSERVAQLDPLIKKLINKLNYEALDIKMEKCKELFALLHDGDYLPGGRASASTLAVELTAGGLTPEHTAYVLGKFDRDGSGIVDFMDFVTYVPLFIEIHQRIVADPLRVDLDL